MIRPRESGECLFEDAKDLSVVQRLQLLDVGAIGSLLNECDDEDVFLIGMLQYRVVHIIADVFFVENQDECSRQFESLNYLRKREILIGILLGNSLELIIQDLSNQNEVCFYNFAKEALEKGDYLR